VFDRLFAQCGQYHEKFKRKRFNPQLKYFNKFFSVAANILN